MNMSWAMLIFGAVASVVVVIMGFFIPMQTVSLLRSAIGLFLGVAILVLYFAALIPIVKGKKLEPYNLLAAGIWLFGLVLTTLLARSSYFAVSCPTGSECAQYVIGFQTAVLTLCAALTVFAILVAGGFTRLQSVIGLAAGATAAGLVFIIGG